MIQELKLNNNEDYDTDFVLSKSNIVKSYDLNHIEYKKNRTKGEDRPYR